MKSIWKIIRSTRPISKITPTTMSHITCSISLSQMISKKAKAKAQSMGRRISTYRPTTPIPLFLLSMRIYKEKHSNSKHRWRSTNRVLTKSKNLYFASALFISITRGERKSNISTRMIK